MAPSMRIHINDREIRAGSIVTGSLICYTDRQRKATDFVVTLALKGVLHTSIPMNNDICEAEKSVYSKTISLTMSAASSNLGQLEVPFMYEIPKTCPPSTSYSNIAVLQYHLLASVTDIVSRISIPLSISRIVRVLPSRHIPSPLPIARKLRRLTHTSNSVMLPTEPYFIQMAYPAFYDIVSFKVTLVSVVKASHSSATFSNKTERPLRDPEVISRRAFDGSNITVLNVTVPEDLESSIDVVGLSRTYTLMVYLCLQDKNMIPLTIDVDVTSCGPSVLDAASCVRTISGSSKLSKSTSPKLVAQGLKGCPATKVTQSAASQHASDALWLGTTQTLETPVVKQQSLLSQESEVSVAATAVAIELHKSHAPAEIKSIQVRRQPSHSEQHDGIRLLTMSQLASRALTVETGYKSDSGDSDISAHSGSTKKGSSSESGSPPGTPKSVFSNFSGASAASASSTGSPPRNHASKNEYATTPRLACLPETTKVQPGEVNSSHQRHVRNISGMSSFESRPKFASISKFAKKLHFGKTMEFSCCGAEDDAVERKRGSFMSDTFSMHKREKRVSTRPFAQETFKRPVTPEHQILGAPLSHSYSNESSPSSVYSCPPLSPSGSTSARTSPSLVLARKLSNSLSTSLKMGKRSPTTETAPRWDEARFSISSFYLGGNDFTFQGISTLDEDLEKTEEEAEYEFGDALRTDEEALGFAV